MEFRNLDQIRERGESPGARLAYWLLGAAGAGALAASLLLGVDLNPAPSSSSRDPLGELLAAQRAEDGEPVPPATQLDPGLATFAEVLADREPATTAIAAVKDERGRLIEPTEESGTRRERPAAPVEVEPLPIGKVLTQTELSRGGSDPLLELARDGTPERHAEPAKGGPGHYQIQVSSFTQVSEAQRVTAELRARGYPAHIEPADVRGRGTWHRVRLGPYLDRRSALNAQRAFEAREDMVTLLVDSTRPAVGTRR